MNVETREVAGEGEVTTGELEGGREGRCML